ncbi:hypothetical protein TSUD_70810 [Trifolium subterraneum]|uniref:Calponin-homology (CH) domain-containing protein n=1 Tax=Trifolium subterraneum TaxID=3900 RepID=A0A2Z6M323_TRISU|nr:hypothetical protein TSUD_70810 [Trifolium subterraneum]
MVCEEESSSTIQPLNIASSHSSSFRELDDAFLQTQTRIWLGEVLQIRLDEQLIISELLANGELLFQVSKVMWKLLLEKHMELRHLKAYKSHPFSSKRNSGIYRPYSNVDSFLKICKILGLTGIDLFTPSDVVERRNTRKVCMCIRSFSIKSRSMNINVPDFDIVTCKVAMPKDMVGCIRRSIELSRSVLTDSSSHDLQKQARRKSSQGTSSNRDYATYSDPTNDTEIIMHPFPQSYDLHADDDLYDYKSEINYNIPDLMVESAFVSGDLGQLDIRNQQRNEISNDEFELLSSMKSLESHCSDNIEHEHDWKLTWPSSSTSGDLNMDVIGVTPHLDTRVEEDQESRNMDYNHFEHDSLRNNAPVFGTPTNDKTSVMGATSHAKNKDADLIDEENSTPNEHQSASSQGSNPTPESIESGRCLDVLDNMEVLQVAGMSCLTREPLNLGDLFDAENNIQNIESFKSHTDKNDQRDKIKEFEAQDLMKSNELVHDIASSERSSYPVNKFEEIEDSLYSPDCHFWNTNSSDRAVPHSNDISSTILKNSLAYEDMESQADSRCSDNASSNQSEERLTCHSYYLLEFCKWDQKGKCVMTSNRVKDDQSSSCLLEDGSHKETTHCKQEDSEVLMSKVMLSCVPSEEGIVNAAAIKLGSDGKLNNGCLDLGSNALGVDKCEKCRTQWDDSNDSYGKGVTIQDIGDRGQMILDMITNDIVALSNCDEDVSNTGCGTTNQSSKLECKDIHQKCHYDKYHICHLEHTLSHIKEEIKPEDESVHSLEYLVETEDDGVKIPKPKPQKKLLLRSVLGGATAVGLLFIFLHLRKNGGEKAAQPSSEALINFKRKSTEH